MLASIRASAIGKHCKEFPVPILLALPEENEDPSIGDKYALPGEAVWTVLPGALASRLEITQGPIDDLVDSALRGDVSGGLTLENPRIENGRACVTVHAWAEIKVFGQKVGFDERRDVCIPLEGCVTVMEFGIGNVDLCFRAPSELFAKLCVGKWGISKCWDACTPIRMSAAASACPTCAA